MLEVLGAFSSISSVSNALTIPQDERLTRVQSNVGLELPHMKFRTIGDALQILSKLKI